MARRTYRRCVGFAQGDLALSAEGGILVMHSGWRFVGFGPPPPLVEVIEEGWIPRPLSFTARAAPDEGNGQPGAHCVESPAGFAGNADCGPASGTRLRRREDSRREDARER